eukprot:scaffold7500_cov127-Isochrysis_galbana.AAC.18
MIGSGARLFEPQSCEARSTAQLLTLLCSFGTPTENEIVAMNPELKSSPHLYQWLRLPPMLPLDDWRNRLARYVRRDEEKASRASSNWPHGTHVVASGVASNDGLTPDHGARNHVPSWWQTHQLSELLEEGTRFLATILCYDPNQRPPADAITRSPFLCCP